MSKSNTDQEHDLTPLANEGFFSKAITDPITIAAISISAIHHKTSRVNPKVVKNELSNRAHEVVAGGEDQIKHMLITQAQTLNIIFHDAIISMSINKDACTNQLRAFADIALRAQNQSRKTLIALAEMNNPKRTTFINQQNNAINQQVNNDIPESENFQIPQKTTNELLEANNGQRLDTRTTLTTGAINPSMEAVEVSRSKNT